VCKKRKAARGCDGGSIDDLPTIVSKRGEEGEGGASVREVVKFIRRRKFFPSSVEKKQREEEKREEEKGARPQGR